MISNKIFYCKGVNKYETENQKKVRYETVEHSRSLSCLRLDCSLCGCQF